MWSKDDIRKKNSVLRRNLTELEVLEKSNAICKNIIDSYIYNECKNLLLFASIQNEVDLSFLFKQAFLDGKSVYYPKTYENDIRFFKVSSIEELKEGKFHIPEPSEMAEEFLENNGLLIAPGLAFSKSGHRIGYGKGYYDRFLSDKSLITIGVGYHFQFENDFEPDEYDIALDYLFSEQGKEL